ncbi:hypothetical protein [Oceanobacillus picturae]|uniref:hypothetical protein n=1 Tax=Oceanobacillus picturae TaxID=171693 RepID=UPI000E68B38B|nr:hypothetical protein [Oceanobacillus picturae]RIU90182.1 hypothetical protein D1864_14140 [Oceanobacillus picturae]
MEVERRKSGRNYQYFSQFAVFEFDKKVITYEQVGAEGSDNDEDNELPNILTNTYDLLMIASVLLVVGGVMFYFQSRSIILTSSHHFAIR